MPYRFIVSKWDATLKRESKKGKEDHPGVKTRKVIKLAVRRAAKVTLPANSIFTTFLEGIRAISNRKDKMRKSMLRGKR